MLQVILRRAQLQVQAEFLIDFPMHFPPLP
jgi:hypothetical protein